MTNEYVNYGSIKCIYSIILPFDLEDCARCRLLCLILQVKVYMSESMLHDQYFTRNAQKMIKPFYDLNYKIIDPMSTKYTHDHCAPVSCQWYPGHV